MNIMWWTHPPPLGVFGAGWSKLFPMQRSALEDLGFSKDVWRKRVTEERWRNRDKTWMRPLPDSLVLANVRRWMQIGVWSQNLKEWPNFSWPIYVSKAEVREE